MNEVQAPLSIREVQNLLRKSFPIMKNNLPLAVGTKVTLDGVSNIRVKTAVSRYCNTTAYLKNIKFGTHRYNLDGTQAEEILPEHKEAARIKLNIRYTKKVWSDNQDVINLMDRNKKQKKIVRFEKRIEHLEGKLDAVVKVITQDKTI